MRGTNPSVARLAQRAPWLCASSSQTVCLYREQNLVVGYLIGTVPQIYNSLRYWLDTGRGAAWLARVLWEHEVPGSNPGAPMRSEARDLAPGVR